MNSKKTLSIILAIMIVISVLPMGDLLALAAGGEPVFTSIIVNKVFKDLYGVEKYRILITGDNFTIDGRNIVEVGIMGGDGTVKAFTPTYSSKTMLQYELKPEEVTGNIFINGIQVDISEDDMPYITNKTPTTGIVDSTGDAKITLKGSGFNQLSDSLKVYLFQGTTKRPELKVISDSELESTELKGKTGVWSVEFEKKGTTPSLKKENGDSANLTITHIYMEMFTIINKLDVSENIDLIPTQGPVESTAMLQADNLKPTNEMSVFFLKSLDDPYLATHMATNENYRRDDKLKKDIFSFTVPKALTPGSYYVVLTNEVDPRKDIKSQIRSYKVLETKFIVIDRKNMVLINSIDPNKGSSKGVDATIKGINIARISSDIYENGSRDGDIDITTNTNKMIVKYIGGTYKMIGENGVTVNNLTREIRFIIGGEVTFRGDSNLEEAVYDYINVRVGENFDKEKLVYDVIVEIKTTIEYKENEEQKTTEIFETFTLKNGFTYEALDYVPKITSIVPDKIPVDSNFNAMEGLKVTIIGENFLLYRYKDEAGNIKYKYPKFDFGGQFKIDPNIQNIEIKILNKQGNEIDGTEGNDLGNKILLTIPAGKEVKKDILNSQLDLKVTNPIRVPDSQDEGSSAVYKFQFIKPERNKTPVITAVTPDTITTSGEKGITITGQNFTEKFTLYMDGEKITTAKRNGTGTEITFDAPPKPEGYVQLIVQNDDGALAVYDKLLYVKTYTDPKITDFNPKKGAAFTLVDLKGQNLVPPNPLVKDLSGIGFMKLIGTRVFLGGEDVNTYTTDHTLKEYETPADNPILRVERNQILPSDYYHSIILEDEDNGAYYKIYFDTKLGKYFLTDGDKDIYEIKVDNNKLYARKGGDPQIELNISQTDIKLGGKILIIKTPYATEKIEGVDTIIGNNVKVLNNNELYFIVPPKSREGYYDVAIVNPDTKKDERKENAGFYYFFQPGDLPPKIEKIDPSEGSVDGEYNIIISGENFVDRGADEKTKVTIGVIDVPVQDIVVSPDGKTMTVKVPKYPGDLSKETDMDRKYVNIKVQNPDGASDSKINGFAYIIPISHPKIKSLILNKGTAAGGDIVTVEGSDFRYFEPFKDANNNGTWDEGETFTDKNNNGKWDDLRKKDILDALKTEWDKLVEPILPIVYFGDKVAKIKSFTTSTIDVEVPKGTKGTVQVYLKNNDSGISNKKPYTYEASNPKIEFISPKVGGKKGGNELHITGQDFAESSVPIYNDLNSLPKEQKIVQLQFANQNDNNMTNANLPSTNLDSGRIMDRVGRAKAGQLELKYDATGDAAKLDIALTENNIKYIGENIPYNDREVFFPLSLLKNEKNESYKGNELVRIKLELVVGANNTYRIRLDRGFSPNTELENPSQVFVVTPSYYTIGDVQVQLINPDGGTATSRFTYTNPDSKPKITNITKDGRDPQLGKINNQDMLVHQISYRGGSTLSIIGNDFRENAIIQIGNVLTFTPNQIEYQLPDRLRVTMPALNENAVGRLYRVVVVNEDGASSASDSLSPPIYIQIIKGESAPTIESITPDSGPVKGGTKVTIKGKDFREIMDGYEGKELSVYFGEVKATEVKVIDYKTIEVITPPNVPGKVSVKVENPDGELAQPLGSFTYLSSPTISAVVDPLDPRENARITTISVEGGQTIKLKGSSFAQGARVVFTPVIKKAEQGQENNANAININGEWYILESGTSGTEINVQNPETIIVKTPQGKEGSKGVIVINPDKGASGIYEDLTYGLPKLEPPRGVEAELVYDRYIKIHWLEAEGAKSYEIYVVINNRETEYIGNTNLTTFVYENLEPNTRYRFIVKTMGEYGLSIASHESNIVRTGKIVGPPDTDGGITENTTINKTGSTVNIGIGTEDYYKRSITIDLTKIEYAGTNKAIITIPAEIVAATDSKNITILGADYKLSFKPNVFAHSNVLSNRDKKDSGIRFTIENNSGDNKAGNLSALSNQYLLQADFFVGKSSTKIDNIMSSIDLTLDFDSAKADLRKAKEVYLGRYDDYSSTWESILTETKGFNSSIRATINKLGRYTIFGKRG